MRAINQTTIPKITLQVGEVKAEFLKTGDLYRLGTESVMVNQIVGNPLDGALNNLYLRIFQQDGSISFTPLLGVHSSSTFYKGEDYVKWTGNFEGVDYAVTFQLAENGVWFWEVSLEGKKEKVDLIYGQDIGLADESAVQTNEAYTAQYVDHQVFKDSEKGYVVCSRQNMPQSKDRHPYLQQGSFSPIANFGTDGFQFFGTSYKETNIPAGLRKENLPSERLQYEFAYTTLQVTPFELDGKEEIVFYGIFQEHHPLAVEEVEFSEWIHAAFEQRKDKGESEEVQQWKKTARVGEPLQVEHLSQEVMEQLYPVRLQEEKDEEKWMSFFTPEYTHVVSKEKERRMERAHGHILFTGGHWRPDESIMTTTSWMYGVFNAQTLVGNTDMNKWLSNTRNPLNILKVSGQRIYVKTDDQYHLLAMPSAFEMGMNVAKWFYQTNEETFIVTVFSSVKRSEIRLQLETKSGKAYPYLITNQVVMNQKEYQLPVYMEQEGQKWEFSADKKALNAEMYPDLTYVLEVKGTTGTLREEDLFVEGATAGSASLAILELEQTNAFELTMQGSVEGEILEETHTTAAEETEKFRSYFLELTNGFELRTDASLPIELEKLNVLNGWYTHNMLVHYLVPHGLEQYGGAAWGTRDVSQGPAEYFLAMQHFDVVKEIIKTIFSHQFIEDGNWPQWFMFDRYRHIFADESHGDITVWPLKLVADYLEATGDHQILEEEIPYMSKDSRQFTEQKDSLLNHLQKEITYIREHFLWDTHLSAYGDGDWDDTLQPHDQGLKVNMASSWTVALTYQALTTFCRSLKEVSEESAQELQVLAEEIRADYNKYILSDEVIPGFVYLPEADQVEFIIHPTDTRTGIHYRLLPMIRGIISGIFTEEQADRHYRLIKEHLECQDGVRLMNQPAAYQGGVSTYFKRAEQAANFGREIGLLYVHAHIRFIEAMAKLGKTEDVWRGLEVINPVKIQDVVPNAEIRQSNAYFSSSDGNFKNRYEAKENFHQLRTGAVSVKGGWRIYSSGPGIYLNQLITNVLGISTLEEDLVLDPVLPASYSGLKLDFTYLKKTVTFKYTFVEEGQPMVKVNGQTLSGTPLENPYRTGGTRFARSEIEPLLQDETIIEVFYQES
ncbi:GH36-type glycosyl hydrolase domain-containing protein [Jeotgalibaca caeni]|uniref:GH36-type glycosyl hydrolase domain-containing protein n=1 Tax=Jeotgalibaca caeni TaxID=3028623 RepID=UPI00237EA701|nr:cellobiose phosphorylase [Jeotgalibaca caeni]MDE1547644.1 cellobiose phosphorylase [Jeotgalibaca caeni]